MTAMARNAPDVSAALLAHAFTEAKKRKDAADEYLRSVVLLAVEAGWSNQRIADAVGLSDARISQIKRGTYQ